MTHTISFAGTLTLVVLPEHDEGLGDFTCLFVGFGDHGHIGDSWMLEQQRFDLCGSDAEALVLDHLFFAVGDASHSPLRRASQYRRCEPAVAQRFGGRFGRFPVTLHDLRPLHDQLALFANAQFDRAGLDIDDLLLRIVNRQANRLDLHKPRVVDRVGVRTRRGLGQAIRGHHGDVRALLEAARQYGRHGSRAALGEAHRMQIVVVQCRPVQQTRTDTCGTV